MVKQQTPGAGPTCNSKSIFSKQDKVSFRGMLNDPVSLEEMKICALSRPHDSRTQNKTERQEMFGSVRRRY